MVVVSEYSSSPKAWFLIISLASGVIIDYSSGSKMWSLILELWHKASSLIIALTLLLAGGF